jgi:7-cyano-7-deazaguanine synthase
MTDRTIALLSGGLDSCCAAAVTHADGAVSIDYGQLHGQRELSAADWIARSLGIPHSVITLPAGLLHDSALLGDGEIPDGRYDEASMSITVVPGRNLLLAALAIAHLDPGAALVTGVHAGDHTIYPDCRPEFWSALGGLVEVAYSVRILTPFLHLTKAEALEAGWRHGAPVQLTYSCYRGGRLHCGRCGTCVERAEAFDLAGIPDPTGYADPDYWREAIKR